MTDSITTELAQRIERQRKAAEWALDAWKKFCDAPDDIDLELILSMEELTLISNHNAASNPASVLALLDALEAKDAHEHENVHYADAAELEIAKLRQRIAELEARTEQQPVAFDELRNAVAEMTGGRPMDWRDGVSKGHQEVPFMNFNSLVRIVDKFRATTAAQPVTVKLPEKINALHRSGFAGDYVAVSAYRESDIALMLFGAGIKIAEGE